MPPQTTSKRPQTSRSAQWTAAILLAGMVAAVWLAAWLTLQPLDPEVGRATVLYVFGFLWAGVSSAVLLARWAGRREPENRT